MTVELTALLERAARARLSWKHTIARVDDGPFDDGLGARVVITVADKEIFRWARRLGLPEPKPTGEPYMSLFSGLFQAYRSTGTVADEAGRYAVLVELRAGIPVPAEGAVTP